MFKNLFLLLVFVVMMSSAARAQQFSYNFNNPSFGGNYFNGSWMLAQAEAQNTHSDRAAVIDRYSRDPIKDFEESLNRQILSQLSREIISSAFGEDSFAEEGHYEIGNYIIDITNGSDGVIIGIQDFSTGGETTVEVPYY